MDVFSSIQHHTSPHGPAHLQHRLNPNNPLDDWCWQQQVADSPSHSDAHANVLDNGRSASFPQFSVRFESKWDEYVFVCVCLCMRLFLIIRRACKTTAKDRLQWIFVLSVHIYHSNRQAHKVLNWQQTVCMHVPVSVCVWLYVYFSRNGVLGRKILPTTEILLPYKHKWTTKSTLFTLENVLCQRDERINQSWGCTTSHQRMLNVLRP